MCPKGYKAWLCQHPALHKAARSLLQDVLWDCGHWHLSSGGGGFFGEDSLTVPFFLVTYKLTVLMGTLGRISPYPRKTCKDDIFTCNMKWKDEKICHKHPRFKHHLFCVRMSCTAKGRFSKKAQKPHHEPNPPPLSDWWKGEFAHSSTITLYNEKQKNVNYSISTPGRKSLASILRTECDPFSKRMPILAYDIWNC